MKKVGRPRTYEKFIPEGYLFCTKCQKTKKEEEFYEACKYHCAECRKQARREKYQKER